MLNHPYYDTTFLEFFPKVFMRMIAFFTGQLPYESLVSDEIQILVLSSVALSSSLVGVFLVLRRMTMLANSLSHTILIGIVLAFFVTVLAGEEGNGGIAPMWVLLGAALLTGVLTTFLTEFLHKTLHLQEDASIGLVFTSLFALGVMAVTILTRDAHIGTEAVMGNADALHRDDLFWVAVTALVNMALFVLFFKEYQITTFDAGLAAAMGISPFVFNYLLMAQVSATTITSFRAVGVILVLAFMTAPVLAIRQWTSSLKKLLVYSPVLGVVIVIVGVALARHMATAYGAPLSTAGIIVSLLFLVVMASFSFRYVRKLS